MIFYFSGTGNSQLAAKMIAETTSDEMISINNCLKKGPIKKAPGVCNANLCLAYAKSGGTMD